MAPPTFPNGMTLYTIGFAALKYPALPPAPVNVPLSNQVGVLQRQPSDKQSQCIAQIASQYIDALLDYQTSDAPELHDPASSQFYLSSALCLLNFLTTSPDVCKRIASRPAVVHAIVDKLLDPAVIATITAASRPAAPHFAPARWEDDFASLLQFMSTMLLYAPEMAPLHPRLPELVPQLRAWHREYRRCAVRTLPAAAERLVEQIGGMDPSKIAAMRAFQDESLVCGVPGCPVAGAARLTLCGRCRIQRYCGKEHQRADWKYHKHICCKGLEEDSAPAAAAS